MKTFALFFAIIFVTACARFERSPGNESFASKPTNLFVATNGNDDWSGTSAAPKNENGPFKTLKRALRAVGELKRQNGKNESQSISIFVRGGTHWLNEPLVITPELSGTDKTPLTISAYSNEKPIISAGRRIAGWREVNIGGRSLWAVPVPDAKSDGWNFHQLWVKGERRQRARHPNSGYFPVSNLPDATSTWEHGHKRWYFFEGHLKAWPSATQGEAVVMTRWVESRMPIQSIDEKQMLLSSSKKSVFQLQPGDLFYVEGIFEVLDQPGEWFLNREEGMLYYQPMPGEKLNNFEAIAPRLMECVRLDGKPEAGKFVQHIIFRGLTFAHNEWYFPPNFGSTERHISTTPDPEILGFAQAAFGVPGIVRAEGAKDCSFLECSFGNLGSYGLQLGRGCRGNRVQHCEFFDLGAGGIRIGETLLRTNGSEQAYGNIVSDCHIHDGGKFFHSGEGVWIGQSYGNKLLHNSIHDFYYTGISIGWTWGYEDSLASNNIVEFNHVHHLGQKSNGDGPILSDMGGIYTLGMQSGTIIRNNLWHDIYGFRYGGWAIYFDEGSSFIRAENNVAFGTTHGGFHQHYGKENVVTNNIFALARDHQLQRTRPEDHVSFTFERNIVYFDRGKLMEGDWSGGKIRQDNNVYFDNRTNAPGINFPGGLEAWRKAGNDVHSVVADPRFVSTNLAEFKLQTNSPALSLGFQPFDLKLIGPRKKTSR